MIKKISVFALLCSLASITQACKLTIKNDTSGLVQVHDQNTNDKIWILPSKSRVVGNDPDKRANFIMTTQVKLFSTPTHYSGKQIACSTSHEINLNVSDIETGTVDSSLFTVEKFNVEKE